MSSGGTAYFAHPGQDGGMDPPQAMWRRHGAGWEYFCVCDWQWHRPVPGQGPSIPPPHLLVPITVRQAGGLAGNRQRWVRYWAWHRRCASGGQPVAVVRRRRDPAGTLDEGFTGVQWETTSAIRESELPQVSNPPHLVEIDQATAERILFELRGVRGATVL